MGYELNKLMQQYGVSTPGAVAYSGPAAPVVPKAPAAVAEGASDEERAAYDAAKKAYDQYQADPTAFNEMMRKYGLAQKEFDAYKQQYQGRVAATPMYTAAQFKTGLPSEPVAPNYASPILSPTFGNVPVNLAGKTEQEKLDYYRRMSDAGYNAADIRGAATSTFGNLPESDWRARFTSLYPQYKPMIEAAYQGIGRGPASIDDPGYNAWLTNLSTGSVKPEDLNAAVYRAAQQNGDIKNATQTATTPGTSAGSVVPIWEWNDPDNPLQWGRLKHGGSVHSMARKYGMGGEVRKFEIGGNQGEPENDIEAMIRERGGVPAVPVPVEPPPNLQARALPAMDVAPAAVAPAIEPAPVQAPVAPVVPPAASVTPVSPAAVNLQEMMNRYLGQESIPYQPELAAARTKLSTESKAFEDLVKKAVEGEKSIPDKSEMYFRLAAAFGAPTKTGTFAESLGNVGKELGEYSKDVRTAKKAERAMQLQLGLEAQKLRMQGAREDVNTLRALASEEMKDKRAILQEYIKSGRPQSEAGKAAADVGLTQGTPQYAEFVNKYIDDKIRSGNLFKEAMLEIAKVNAAIAAGGLDVRRAAEARQAEQTTRLSPAEVKLKSETETNVGSIDDSLSSLGRAFSLNDKTFDGTYTAIGQRKLIEQTNPNDPRVIATREQINLLSRGAIDRLRASFGGNPTEGERAALLQLEGIDSKGKEERGRIMMNAYRLLKARQAREQKRLSDINAGRYRETTQEQPREPE